MSSVKYPTSIKSIIGTFNFKIECPVAAVMTVDPYPNEIYNFDLLQDNLLTVPLPILTLLPADCFSITWSVKRASDGADMLDILPAMFSIN